MSFDKDVKFVFKLCSFEIVSGELDLRQSIKVLVQVKEGNVDCYTFLPFH